MRIMFANYSLRSSLHRRYPMKICPRCRKTYPDDNLNFCLEDGSVLEQAPNEPMPETVMMNQPRVTEPTRQVQNAQFGVQPAQPQWNTAPQPYSMQPKKSSKTWVWVLLILCFLALLCGGGLVGLFVIGSQMETANSSTTPTPKKGSSSPSPSKSPDSNSGLNNSKGDSDRTNVTNLDLASWVLSDRSFGKTEYSDGELIMASSKPRFYFVLAGTKDQITENADTLVSVANINSGDTILGYGLVFHSNPKPLQQGYAFLIDSEKQRYRVVRHSQKKEIDVVGWTNSNAIKSGDAENRLEVRDKGDSVDLYINDQKVTSVTTTFGYPNGVVGLYAADAIDIGFKDLQIRK